MRRPHLIWLIDKAVCFTTAGLLRHKALWWRVLRALTWALQEIGADPGGLSNPMRVKNPLCGRWTGTAILEEAPWSLAEMKRGLRLDVSDDDFAAARDLCLTKFDGDTPAAPDHADSPVHDHGQSSEAHGLAAPPFTESEAGDRRHPPRIHPEHHPETPKHAPNPLFRLRSHPPSAFRRGSRC